MDPDTDAGPRAQAWLLPLAGGRHVAVGAAELSHILPEAPRLFPVPGAPPHCRLALIWNDAVVPLMELRQRLGQAPNEADGYDEAANVVAIVAYRAGSSGAIAHGAIRLAGIPSRAAVADADACPLPNGAGERALFLSCFRHSRLGPVPVLDLQTLFGEPPPVGPVARAEVPPNRDVAPPEPRRFQA